MVSRDPGGRITKEVVATKVLGEFSVLDIEQNPKNREVWSLLGPESGALYVGDKLWITSSGIYWANVAGNWISAYDEHQLRVLEKIEPGLIEETSMWRQLEKQRN